MISYTTATSGTILWFTSTGTMTTRKVEPTKQAAPPVASLRSKRLASARAQLSAELPKDWRGRKR